MIDSHHHFFDPAARDYPWMTGNASPLRRRFGPDDLQPLLTAMGVEATVLVQTVGEVTETREFLATAAVTPYIAGVVGWVDLTASDVAETLAALKAGPGGEYLVGIRHQVHDEPDPNWLLRPDVGRGLSAVAEADLVYDFLIRPRETPAAIEVARRFPHLRFVVDHLAKPIIAPFDDEKLDAWDDLMSGFAGHEHVACKLSGLVTEAGPGWLAEEELAVYCAIAFRIFGEDRLMFGSDWPVCTLVASYDRVVGALRDILITLGPFAPGVEEKIWGGNAARWYGLSPGAAPLRRR